MPTATNRPGTIEDKSGAKLADVIYTLSRTGLDDATGSIRIGNDPERAAAFTGDPARAGGQQTFFLVAENGVKVEIFFTSSGGAFRCVLADEAGEALK